MNRSAIAILLGCVSLANAAELRIVAGNGSTQNNGDAGNATELAVKDTFGVEFGPDGGLYVTEVGHHRIRRVDLQTNQITTVAGTGSRGFSGDGGLATQAQLNEPYEVRFDNVGNMYFVELQNHLIRRINAKTKRISTVAGIGKAGFAGDGGPATKASFNRPHSIALDDDGNLFVADIGNHRIRRINLKSHEIETIAGTGEKRLPVNGQRAEGNPLLGPRALYVVGDFMWIALREGHSVWKLDLKSGELHHVAGSGKKGFADGKADRAQFNGPKGIAVDASNNVFVVDTENHVIRRIDGKDGSVSTIAGTGVASRSTMNRPHGICLGPDGGIFVGDTLNHRVVQVK